MRMAGRLRAGFFPCPPRAIELLAERLTATEREFSMLDICCGSGDALHQLASLVNCKSIYGVELDPHRGAEAQSLMPDSTIVYPASSFGMSISYSSMGLVYLNPPFDEDMQNGGRVETKFLEAVTPLIVDNGVLVMVVPEHVTEDSDFQAAWVNEFENISQGEFPPDHRNYGEVFVVGTRLKEPLDLPYYRITWKPADLWKSRYHVPPSKGPKRFEKAGFTDEELLTALAGSSLNRMLVPKKAAQTPAPPMALGAGHLALMLAAGFLDGVVDTGGDDTHVVRGVAAKEFEQTSSETEETESGSRTVTILSERMKLSVRAAFQDGTITDYAMEE